LITASVDLKTQLSEESAADEAVTGPCRANLAQAEPVRDEIGNAIKLLKRKQTKVVLRTADQAIARAMTAAREALRSDNPDDMNGIHLQLSKKVEEMEAAAANVDGEFFSSLFNLGNPGPSTPSFFFPCFRGVNSGFNPEFYPILFNKWGGGIPLVKPGVLRPEMWALMSPIHLGVYRHMAIIIPSNR
jgi:hypothetical protein